MLDNVSWLGHDSFRIVGESSGTTVYIDPWKLAAGAPSADLVLVTHDHYDHFSAADIASIATPATVLVGPAEVTRAYAGESRTVAAGDVVSVAGVTVEAVAAYNVDKFKSPGRVFHPRDDGKVGFVATIDGRRYYHAGDTDAIPEMAGIDVDVAMLPVSGTYVMTADEAGAACVTLRAGIVVPMHYDTIVGSVADARRFAERCPLPVEVLPRSER
jgi:L-ascorbate metabolism protein UlaG (beta-lactamase superfamily)